MEKLVIKNKGNINQGLFVDFFRCSKNDILPELDLNSDNIPKKSSIIKMKYAYLFAFDGDSYLSVEQFRKKQEEVLEKFRAISVFTEPSIEINNPPYNFLLVEVKEECLILNKIDISSVTFSRNENGDVDARFQFREKDKHILFYESLDVMFVKDKQYKPVRLGFGGLGATEMKETVFKGLPLFYQVEDFERDKVRDWPTTLTYGDLLRAQRDLLTKKELLQKHLKKASDLEGIINFNKFTVTEVYTLVKAATEFEEKTFINFVKWFREKGRYIKIFSYIPYKFKNYRSEIMIAFVLDSIGESGIYEDDDIALDDTSYYLARDYIRMCRMRRRKVKIDFSSSRKLEEKHDKLFASIENKNLKERHGNSKFEIYDEYRPLIEAVNKHSNPLKYLKRPIDLIVEGNKMGHCVGSYIGAVEMGECVILTVDLDDIHYTLEVSAVVKDDGLAGYHLCQMQSKYNGGVKNPDHRNQVITFLNNIDLSIKKRKRKTKKK